MKTEQEILGKLAILKIEFERFRDLGKHHPTELILVSKLDAIGALEWVLGENDEW